MAKKKKNSKNPKITFYYSHMQHIQSNMQNEVDFCKSRTGNMWREVGNTKAITRPNRRVARKADTAKRSAAADVVDLVEAEEDPFELSIRHERQAGG